jgi:RNA polymerase sigma-70 factor (ECF subfamily)
MDPGLVVLAQGGDRAAFHAIAEESAPRLKQVAYRILRDAGLAEDATQGALLEMWRSLPRLRDPARFEGWSYRFVVRACHREAKRSRRAIPALPDPRLAITRPTAIPDGTGVVLDRDQLERGFRRLSVDQRAVVVLHYYLDLTLEDTARALGVSVGTAKSRLHRAMVELRLALYADARATPEPEGGLTR